MFARKVAARLKPNSLTEFINLMECEILPWLRTQEGFLDLITLAAPDGMEVAAISFWDSKANAQAYHAGRYPEVLGMLGKLLDAPPYVKTFDVMGSTLQRVDLAPSLKKASLGLRAENGRGPAGRGQRLRAEI
jgi:heme-degrading monooxygenase HmoA